MAKWLIFASILSVAVSVSSRTFAATLTSANLNPNNLVITEYLANPVGITDAEGEYFEIFNTTSHSIDLGGLVVRDDGTNSFTVTALLLAPQSFAVFSNSDGTSLGITPDYVYAGGMTLTNTADEIGLYRPDGMAINQLIYTDGDFFGAGIAHELDVLNWSTPAIVNGPVPGTDFIAASALLPFNNTGSPGLAGNTTINLAAVPLPASFWMFGSALGMLCWLRRKAGQAAHFALEALTYAQQTSSNDLDGADTAGTVPTGCRPVSFN